jgi:hypothetical protein
VIESNYSTKYLTINSELKSGLTVSYVEGENSGTATIKSISDFKLTSSMLSGKEIYVSDDSGTGTFQFKSDGTYYEVWTDDGDEGSCTGNWIIEENNIVTIENGNCSDNEPAGYLIFNEEPKDGSSFYANYEQDGSDGTTYLETVVITSISNI